jgi:hypothetical protein
MATKVRDAANKASISGGVTEAVLDRFLTGRAALLDVTLTAFYPNLQIATLADDNC